MSTCVVCRRRYKDGDRFMCNQCGRSYDRARDKDVTIMACIIWAAKRARRFAK